MSEHSSYDVAVVGYGPTGVTAANMLGAMGLRVLVVERDESIYARARAISTDEEVLRIWQRLGLADRLKRDMLADKPIDFVDGRGRSFLSFAPRSRGNAHPPQLFIYQPALEQTLRDGVDRYPNVQVLLGHECLRVRQDEHGVELMLVDLRTDTISRPRVSYVIAADGGSSPIRGQLGVGFEGRTYEDRWVVIDTEVLNQWPTHDRLRFHCDPERPAVDCPTPLGHHRWEFPVLPGEDEKALVTDEMVWRLLNRQGITENEVKLLRAVVYSHHVRFAARWRVGRVFLAGDAAHVMPPWIGQGMAAGVRDMDNLCWKIAAVLDGSLPESVLDSYETERQPHVREVTSRAVFFGRVITERRPAVTALRNPAFRVAMKLPAVGSYLRDARWFPAAYYPKGFLSGKRRAAVGHRPPQPFVRDASGERRRLDDVLGSRWVLLVSCDSIATQQAWSDAGADTLTIGGPGTGAEVVDVDGVLTTWMRRHNADVLALRPDGFVYAAAPAGATLPPPPIGLTVATPS
jgi:3-(3-hydroxy-phenyl)propionate hydroxylase